MKIASTLMGSWFRRRFAVSAVAFSRTDLLACAGALALAVCCTVPLLANTAGRTERLVCMSNLKEIGQAFNSWAADHGDRYSWYAPTFLGGVRGHPLAPNPWFQFAALSNELRSPFLLACPSDAFARPAHEFTSSANGGFYHPNFRNNSISYFIGLHASHLASRSMLGGDGNIGHSGGRTGCSQSETSDVAGMSGDPQFSSPWREGYHGTVIGNVLFASGQVEEASPAEVRQALRGPEVPNGIIHVMPPRW